MWHGPGQDPGGGPDSGPPPSSSRELSDLKDQFEQQQVLIAQLKEMLRKDEQSSVTQEKVDEYMNTLSRRSKKGKKDDNKKTVEIPASEKISLLRQQVEQNKAKFAERGKSQKGIEEMVTQLKAQLDDSQSLMSPFNVSLQEAKMEYSENSSSQELYLALLAKEKRVSDLLVKIQKLEGSILDLQENVKEKDSVIDARTKAITLMTESLSRKGKNTLDELDDTREQMRKMQENFISLEGDMKARQVKFLDDLRQKNFEIADLQETILKLEAKNKFYEGKEDEDDKTKKLQQEQQTLLQEIKEKEIIINELQSKVNKNDETESDEICKLKKQLEESNKSMIKVKAQHKAKLKELNKKIESFKKVNDSNAEIVKLEAENSKFTQKIAELEEEKGNLQLRLVESDSNKGSEASEHKNELEEKIRDQEYQMEEQSKVISILENEIIRAKNEIQSLYDQLNGQVSSEMTSIHFEEQLEKVEQCKNDLISENEKLLKEKDDLLESLEQLKKEKQEIASKLEHYIQENIELIDKLEKLSAEKVSSAESIEIVEGLTQQEKLELAAYQKNLDIVAGNLKTSEENLPQGDLNESVNELTEETSELLQKIELFTVERREVMEKMEQLKQENVNLNLKITEVENNRDILAETYEQLQNEKEALAAKLNELERTSKDVDDKGNLDEILESFKAQLEDEKMERNKLNNTIIDLNRTLSDLENDNKSLEMKINELEESKNNLSYRLVDNEEALEIAKNAELENHRLLTNKDNEITKLMKERDNTESVILDLQKSIKEKDESFHKLTADLKVKYQNLQKQLEDNSGNLHNITSPLEKKIEELTVKNKEQLEKMKKIAANLKKKTQSCQELEGTLKDVQEKQNVSLQQLENFQCEIRRLTQANEILEQKNVDLQNVIIDLKDRNNEVNLQQELLLTKENLGSVESTLRSKIQELEMLLETREIELQEARVRVGKLEEAISVVEETRYDLEKRVNDLSVQLQEKEQTCQDMSCSENELEQKLIILAEQEDIIEKKLEAAVTQSQELSKENKTLSDKNEKMKRKLIELRETLKKKEEQQKIIEELEATNEDLRKQIHELEGNLRHLENVVEESKNDFEKVNNDWQTQFEEVVKEKNELMAQCEKFGEELRDISENGLGFNDELEGYKMKLEHGEIQMKNYEEQIQVLSLERENLEVLKKDFIGKEEELENLRRESKEKEQELQRMLLEKDERIGELSNEIEKRRMEENKPKGNDLAAFFDTVVPEDSNKIRIADLERTVEDLQLEKLSLVATQSQLQEELNALKQRNDELAKTMEQEVFNSNNRLAELEKTSQPTLQHEEQSVPTFVWAGQSNDTFDFVQPTLEPSKTENSQSELLDKIKTLEFMLFNAERDKEDALSQCQQLTNELTHLIYEKQMPPVEDSRNQVESQILSNEQIVDNSRQELHNLEFQPTKAPQLPSQFPVSEELCSSKETYQCFGENDDGWGCGPEEAKLEEEHAQKEDLVQRIRALELERDSHLEDIKQLQLKSAKLIKRLKELKVKNEELSKRKEVDLFNLDDAIQEELKIQIQQVEKKLKETVHELEKERNEKNAVLKKVEVLTSANERMVEMKEKQDVELLSWQRNYRELNAKLERFEWGDEGFTNSEISTEVKTSSDPNLQAKIDELNATIKDLSLDNEELQSLLEEQRSLRIEAEKHFTGIEKKKFEDEINVLIQKNSELNEKLLQVEKMNVELVELEKSKSATISDLEKRVEMSDEEKVNLYRQITEKDQLFEENNVLLKDLHEKNLQIESLIGLEAEKQTLFAELQEKNALIVTLREELDKQTSSLKDELDVQYKAAETLLEEKRVLTVTKDEEISRLTLAMDQMSQEWTLRIDQRGSDVAESWKLHLETRESEFAQLEQVLRKEIYELEGKTNALVNENNELRKNVDAEIRNEVDRVAALQQQINDRQKIITELTRNLQERQNEIENLKHEIQEIQKHLDDEKEIVDQVVEVAHTERNKEMLIKAFKDSENHIVALRAEINEIRSNLYNLQEEHSKKLEALNYEIQGKDQLISSLNTTQQQGMESLQQNILEYQQFNESLNSQLQAKLHQVEEKDREITNLQFALEEKEVQYSYSVDNVAKEYQMSIDSQNQEIDNLKKQLLSMENHYEELLVNKQTEIESIHFELTTQQQRNHEIEGLSQQLSAKIQECDHLQTKITEQNVLMEEENKQLTELRTMIEEQVLKIEELKSELYQKSKDYDSIVAQMDLKDIPKHRVEESDDLSEPASRAELDLALYMLHQRDVRCEELTVELTQLLEERDTLQLRLSNVLREKEELGRKMKDEAGIETVEKVEVPENFGLTTKLFELKNVGYKKDKTIVDEQKLRRLQQLSIMQQHRDDAAKLPPEAAARLVDASYTLSRDVQSPSKVLLNWLWGKSTPKVNNI